MGFLLHDFLGSCAFPNTSEILSDVHGDLLKDLVDSVRFGLVLLAFVRASFLGFFIKAVPVTIHTY